MPDNIIDIAPKLAQRPSEFSDEERFDWLMGATNENLWGFRAALGGRKLKRSEAQDLFLLIASHTHVDSAHARVLADAMDRVFLGN